MGKKVLLADDSATIQKLVEMALSDTDFELTAVSNGKQAVDILDSFQPDIILADAIMPHMDGYEVCAHVKQSPQFAQTPVVLLTGRFQPFDEDKARQAAIDERLIKPFSQEQLVQMIEKLASNLPDQPDAEEPAPTPSEETLFEEPPAPPAGISPAETVQFDPDDLTAHAQSMAQVKAEAPSLSDFDLTDAEDAPEGEEETGEAEGEAAPLEMEEPEDITLELTADDLAEPGPEPEESRSPATDEATPAAESFEFTLADDTGPAETSTEAATEEPVEELSAEDLESVEEPQAAAETAAAFTPDFSFADETAQDSADEPSLQAEDLEDIEPLGDEELALELDDSEPDAEPLSAPDIAAESEESYDEIVEIDEPLLNDEAEEALDTEPVEDPLASAAFADDDLDTEPVGAPDAATVEEDLLFVDDETETDPAEEAEPLAELDEPLNAIDEGPEESVAVESPSLLEDDAEDAHILEVDTHEAFEAEEVDLETGAAMAMPPAEEAEQPARPPEPEAAPVPEAGQDAAPASTPLTDAQLDAIADRVADKLVAKLGSETVRDIAWNVVPELAEAMIKKRIYELEQAVDAD